MTREEYGQAYQKGLNLTVRVLVSRGLAYDAAQETAQAAWVASEFLRGYLFGGFPWVPLGNSQVTVLPVEQLASLLGVYGLSALVAFAQQQRAHTQGP